MSESVSAAITIQGSMLRYAEVERGNEGLRLLRIGKEDFSFDLKRVLLTENGSAE